MPTLLNPHAHETPSSKAVERTMEILESLDSSKRGLSVSEISRKLGMPKSSAHVLMVTLERLGYIRRASNGRHFSLGLKTYALGQRMAKSISVSDVALLHMQALVDDMKLTAHLAILDHDQGVYIQKVEPPGLIKFDTYVGRRMDLHCTALGKVILAFDASEEARHILSKKVFARYTPKTITSQRILRGEVGRVRRLGYAIDNEEEELGARCVAVPVLHEGIRFLAALSLSGTVSQVPLQSIESSVARLEHCAAAIAADNAVIPGPQYSK
jgi:IclR family KDG regulon transcriptional repressor